MLESVCWQPFRTANEGEEADVRGLSILGNAYMAVYISGKEF